MKYYSATPPQVEAQKCPSYVVNSYPSVKNKNYKFHTGFYCYRYTVLDVIILQGILVISEPPLSLMMIAMPPVFVL